MIATTNPFVFSNAMIVVNEIKGVHFSTLQKILSVQRNRL